MVHQISTKTKKYHFDMKRLSFDAPGVFDLWRKLYDTLTEQEHREFYDDLERYYPHQQSFTIGWWFWAFSHIQKKQNCTVLEVGGWKGELAERVLSVFGGISTWTSVELSREAIKKTICNDERFSSVAPPVFRWFAYGECPPVDVFVASHVIEHLHNKDLLRLLRFLKNIPVVLFEAPISEFRNDWTGYHGSHILTLGWQSIDKAMKKNGFEHLRPAPMFTVYYKRGDFDVSP